MPLSRLVGMAGVHKNVIKAQHQPRDRGYVKPTLTYLQFLIISYLLV